MALDHALQTLSDGVAAGAQSASAAGSTDPTLLLTVEDIEHFVRMLLALRADIAYLGIANESIDEMLMKLMDIRSRVQSGTRIEARLFRRAPGPCRGFVYDDREPESWHSRKGSR